MHLDPRHRYRAPVIAGTLLLATVLFGGVVAEDLPDRDALQAQEVVKLQLKAFEHDDAGKAFDMAHPGVRSKFASAESFLAMVRAHYPMVHRPTSVLFLKAESDGDTAFQKVRLTDTEGAVWLVTYMLHRQPDKAWRISACLVTPDGQRLQT